MFTQLSTVVYINQLVKHKGCDSQWETAILEDLKIFFIGMVNDGISGIQ